TLACECARSAADRHSWWFDRHHPHRRGVFKGTARERPAKPCERFGARLASMPNHSAAVAHISLKSSLLIQLREPFFHSAETPRFSLMLSGSLVIVAISLPTRSSNRSPTVHLIFIAM